MSTFLYIYFALLAVGVVVVAWAFLSTRDYVKGHGLRCRLGFHSMSVDNMDVEKGMGIFGGPLVTFEGHCYRCETRMSS